MATGLTTRMSRASARRSAAARELSAAAGQRMERMQLAAGTVAACAWCGRALTGCDVVLVAHATHDEIACSSVCAEQLTAGRTSPGETTGAPGPPVLDRGEAARMLGVSVATVDRLCKAGALAAATIGRRVVIRRQSVARYLAAQEEAWSLLRRRRR